MVAEANCSCDCCDGENHGCGTRKKSLDIVKELCDNEPEEDRPESDVYSKAEIDARFEALLGFSETQQKVIEEMGRHPKRKLLFRGWQETFEEFRSRFLS